MKARIGNDSSPDWFAAVLIFHSQSRSRTMLKVSNAKPFSRRVVSGLAADDIFETVINGKRIGILAQCAKCFGGGPFTSILVEELHYLKVKYIIGLGCAGSIVPEMDRGRQFVINPALVNDGTSKVYLPETATVDPDPNLLRNLHGLPVYRKSQTVDATAATIDAIYRETEELMGAFRKQGAEIIKMEAGPLYSACLVCGIPTIYVGHVSDQLLNSEWNNWYGEERNEMAERSAEIVYQLLEKLTI